MKPTNNSRRNRGLVWLAVGAASLGIGAGAASLASAESSSSSTDNTVQISSSNTGSTGSDSTTTPTPPTGGQMDPSSLPNGPGETVLTGDTAAKVTAAAEAAEPGSTVIRVETDSSGHAYEAHVKLADGTVKTLYFDESYADDGSDTGFGPAPAGQDGQDGHHGQPPTGQPPAAPTTGA